MLENTITILTSGEEKNGNAIFFRKILFAKYKCVMLWLLSIISLTEFLYLFLQKTDDDIIRTFFIKYFNSTDSRIIL